MEEVKFFFINLYENKDSCLEDVDLNKIFYGYDILKLNYVMKEKIENDILREEIMVVLKGMKNNK